MTNSLGEIIKDLKTIKLNIGNLSVDNGGHVLENKLINQNEELMSNLKKLLDDKLNQNLLISKLDEENRSYKYRNRVTYLHVDPF